MASATSAIVDTASARVTSYTLALPITATAGQLLSTVISIPATATPSKVAAQSILDGEHTAPNVYDPTNPIRLFIIQVAIIVAFCRILAIGLAKIRQPRVISEVITGLLLGPSVFGRIPGFTNAIFPAASMPNLSLVANLGLVFFLFLVGLEADLTVFKHDGKKALLISFAGLVIPFGLGAAVSVGIYEKFVDTGSVDFGIFTLFIGVAMAITAFPVLARILTELKLLRTNVGLTVLAAGVGNDVVGWILLALSVALANAGKGVSAVYILLCAIGFGLVLWFVVRPVYMFLLRKSGSLEHGPSPGIMVLTFFLVLAAAFLTDVIGIHAIFGSFMVGILVVPHNHGFAAAITEKIEDFVSILFIPIYFSLSGLKTDLGLLNNGEIWGWAICVIVVAFVSKFVSCGLTARLCGLPNRESLAVGSLMSCKGLVELIVLNIGLQAGILNNSVFAMFVVMALVTTFATTPLTMWFYPESYWRPKLEEAEDEKRALDMNQNRRGSRRPSIKPDGSADDEENFRRRFVVVLETLESLPPIMSFVRLLQPFGVTRSNSSSTLQADGRRSTTSGSDDKHASELQTVPLDKLEKETANASAAASTILNPAAGPDPAVTLNAFRLLPLTERTSDLFKASEEHITKKFDSILNIFSSFASLAGLHFSTSMSIIPHDQFADRVIGHAAAESADMLVLPWAAATASNPESESMAATRLESLFGAAGLERSIPYASFVRRVFLEAASDVALVLDAGNNGDRADHLISMGNKHIFLPFFGGPDDRAALEFVVQLVANNPDMQATVTRFSRPDIPGHARRDSEQVDRSPPLSPIGGAPVTAGLGLPRHDTIYPRADTQAKFVSETEDHLALSKYFPTQLNGEDAAHITPVLPSAVSRITFTSLQTASPLRSAHTTLQTLQSGFNSVLVVTGRSRRSAPKHHVELDVYLKEKVASASNGMQCLGIAASSDVRKTLGDMGSALVASGDAGTVIILQSALEPGDAITHAKGKSV